MKHNTLYLKFICGYLLFGILSFITISVYTSNLTNNYVQKEEAHKISKAARRISTTYARNYYKNKSKQGDKLTREDLQEHMMAIDAYLDAMIWIVDKNGDVIISSRDPIDIEQSLQIKDFDITIFDKYYQVGDFFGYFDTNYLSVYSTITLANQYQVQGYVFIHKNTDSLSSHTNGFINISFITLAVLMICALIMLIFYTITIYFPIRKIVKTAASYGQGDFEPKAEVYSNDEIGYLAASLNYMATELNTLEEDQRKFIANISHDFRSPLTSIKGYIEAIMDGTIPHEMQDKYLNIIIFETERLNKLTSSMLELNKYGGKSTMLDLSSFDINQIIKKTVQSFGGLCSEKRITFELILSGQTLFVIADMSKIQQVLYNLIDNAIRFSSPDSTILIETTEKNEKVFISVKDKGVGIPKESLNKIWERFYKTDTSRGKDKRGTGLGLAIVKEIIQVHNENINVVSTEGVGSEFIFTLPLSNKDESLNKR